MPSKICLKCGEPANKSGDWCSKHRNYRTMANKPDIHLICLKCGNGFVSKNPAAKACSVSCRNSLNGKKCNPLTRNYGERKCDACGKYFTIHAPHQVYCDTICLRKANYRRNVETYRARDKIKVSKQRIGLNIRDETLQTPSNDAKWLWDGVGRWSWKYWPDIQECLECNTSVYRHNSNGICDRCYDKLRPRDPEQQKEWKKKSYERARARGHKFSGQVSKEWIEKAKKKEIPITPKIENLLDNLERL